MASRTERRSGGIVTTKARSQPRQNEERTRKRKFSLSRTARRQDRTSFAGKRRSGRTRKGSRWLGIALTEAAQANTRSRDTYLSAQYRRLKTRRGHRKAIGAVRHSIIVAVWHMLTTGEIYNDAGGDYFARLDPDKQTRRLVAQLERLGHVVTLQEAAA